MGVSEDFVTRGSVERAPFGVFDAWIELESCFLGAARVIDAIGAGKRVNIFVVQS